MADFVQDNTLEYGAESRLHIEPPAEIVPNNGALVDNEDENVGVQYLKKIIESCKEQNIEVLLVYLPHPMSEEKGWKSVNTAEKVAKDYNVKFINFMDKNVVDYTTDCNDSDSHLNPSGAWKVSDYLGSYLQENYDLPDHRGDDKYEYWNTDFAKYTEHKNARLNDVPDFVTYLMLLQDQEYGFGMDVGNPTLTDNFLAMNLLKNKGVDISQMSRDTKYVIVNGKDSQVINEEISEDQKQGILNAMSLS